VRALFGQSLRTLGDSLGGLDDLVETGLGAQALRALCESPARQAQAVSFRAKP
jgi:hypothetical protein